MTEILIGPTDKTVTVTVQQRTWKTPADTFRILVPIDSPSTDASTSSKREANRRWA
jgi:hypothetical protein